MSSTAVKFPFSTSDKVAQRALSDYAGLKTYELRFLRIILSELSLSENQIFLEGSFHWTALPRGYAAASACQDRVYEFVCTDGGERMTGPS